MALKISAYLPLLGIGGSRAYGRRGVFIEDLVAHAEESSFT